MTTDPKLPIPLTESVWPPVPLHDERTPLSLRVEGVELNQSEGRLSVVSHFTRRVFALQMGILSLSSLSPFYTYWTSPFHHATWRAMLPAVFATYKQIYLVEPLTFLVAALLYWMLIVSSNLSGVVLNLRNSTVKAGGRTRPLNKFESVSIIAGQPDILRRHYTVQLHWHDGQNLRWWQKLLLSMGPKTSFIALFRQEANADRLAAALAEFANVPVQHRTR